MTNSIWTVIGLIIGLASLTLAVTPHVRDWLACHTPDAFRSIRYRNKWDLNHVHKLVARAKNRVWILQTWVPNIRQDIRQWERAASEVNFRVLLASDDIAAKRLEYRRESSHLADECTRRIRDAQRIRKTIQLKHYSGLPFGPIYIVDSVVYFGLFFASEDALDKPVFKCRTKSPFGASVVDSFEAIWNSRSSLGDNKIRIVQDGAS